MIVRCMILVAITAGTVSANSFIPSFDVPANSRLGSSLLAKATPENEGARKLDEEYRDSSWLYNYKIKYLSCYSLIQIGGDIQNLVKFGVCKASDTCSTCSVDATYVLNMVDFVDAYTEHKLTELEKICEMVRENCSCDDDDAIAKDDELCLKQCYTNAGTLDCLYYKGGPEFEVQRFLDCAELENTNTNNNKNNLTQPAQYFCGPYCSEQDGKSIYLGIFTDQGCNVRTSSDIYEDFNYGQSLPFSTESIVTSDCISCKKDVDDNNNNIIELCKQTIEGAAKCESNLDPGQNFYPDTSSCDYINSNAFAVP